MTAVEIVDWLSRNYLNDGAFISAFGKGDYSIDELVKIFGAEEVIRRIEEYEAENDVPGINVGDVSFDNTEHHSDVKWFFRCHDSSGNALDVDTEEEAIRWCEDKVHQYCYAWYNRICTME